MLNKKKQQHPGFQTILSPRLRTRIGKQTFQDVRFKKKKKRRKCRLGLAHAILLFASLWMGAILYSAVYLLSWPRNTKKEEDSGVDDTRESQGDIRLLGDDVASLQHNSQNAGKELEAPQVGEVLGAKNCSWTGPFAGFLPGCPKSCSKYKFFWEAQEACEKLGSTCGGITVNTKAIRSVIWKDPGIFELRGSHRITSPKDSVMAGKRTNEEWSYLKNCDIAIQSESELSEEEIELDNKKLMVNGEPTIFVGVASYRDEWCYKSITTGFERATHPERLSFGVVQQNKEQDVPCLWTEKPCEEDPEQVICKYRDQIRLVEIDANDAKGPTFGRHHADKQYRGEYFALQVDAHMSFINGWDEVAIRQWENLHNDYAILTTYPSDTKSISENGDSLVKTAPIICKTKLLGSGMIKHEAAGETYWPSRWKEIPLISPFLGAGILFSRGHRITRVPYDCCLDYIFDGEEFSLGARAFTWGYDFYAPSISFAFHPYRRKRAPPLFWNNRGSRREPGSEARARSRIKHILGMRSAGNYGDKDIDKYGLGPRRPLERYLKTFGVDLTKKGLQKDNCRDAFKGTLMDYIHTFIRKNGKGIDYNFVSWNDWNIPDVWTPD